MVVKARWRGGKIDDPGFEYISGIPARSLQEDEYDALTEEQQQAVQDSPLYTVRAASDAPEADDEAEPKEGDS